MTTEREFDRDELAWAAGFFDADGCFSYTESTHFASASIDQVVRAPLDRFRHAVGVGNVSGPYTRSGKGRWSKKPQYVYQAYGRKVVTIADRLWFSLGALKRSQFLALHQRAVQWNPSCATWPVPEVGRTPSRREDLAWAAGFVDGEGCFSCSSSNRYPCVSVTQAERNVLDRLKEVLSIGKIYGPYRSNVNDGWNRKPHYFFRVHGFERVQYIAAVLWFQLSSHKKTQAALVLANQTTTCHPGHRKIPGHGGCGICTARYWAMRRQAKANALLPV